MKLRIIDGGMFLNRLQWVEQKRQPGDIVTIKNPFFSTVTISGRLVQAHPNGTATIWDPCNPGQTISGEYIRPMIRDTKARR